MTQYAKLSADSFYVIQETAMLYNHYDSHYMAPKRPLEVLLLGAIFFLGRFFFFGGGGGGGFDKPSKPLLLRLSFKLS